MNLEQRRQRMGHFFPVVGQTNAKANILFKIRNIMSKGTPFLHKFISAITPV